MNLSSFNCPNLETFRTFTKSKRSIVCDGLSLTSSALLGAIAYEVRGENILWVVADSDYESKLMSELPYFLGKEPINIPAWETLPGEKNEASKDITGQRYQALYQLSEASEKNCYIVPIQSLQQKVLSKTLFAQLSQEIQVGQSLSLSSFIETLLLAGYEEKELVSDKGQFARRSGIVDLFPPNLLEPIRVEFWGDEIDSMRSFDALGQKKTEKITSALILPASEGALLESWGDEVLLTDYFGSDFTLIFDGLHQIEDRYVHIESQKNLCGNNFVNFSELYEQLKDKTSFYFSDLQIHELSSVKFTASEVPGFENIEFSCFSKSIKGLHFKHPFLKISERFIELEETQNVFFSAIKTALSEEMKVNILCSTSAEKVRLDALLKKAEIDPQDPNLKKSEGYLSHSLVIEEAQTLIAPLTEYNRHYRMWRPKLRVNHTQIPNELLELELGDTVVHLHHGIGRYQGVEKRKDIQGKEKEYLIIKYADEATLAVPIEQSYLINKYVGIEHESPELHSLSSNKWKRLRTKTEEAIEGYARDLLKLYAKREVNEGFTCCTDSEEMRLFEEDFPYSETEDQLNAICAIKNDLINPKPMDRLVCGDVGYGKTEVAMRAAFKVVCDGERQVAVLAPTTILALQHYENFSERMKNFGVTIGLLSRFSSSKERKETLEKAATGKIDILIGTHRILSKDVQLDNLGLIIIDEEQRFGVKAKEHLRMIKEGVNYLTLSATPIPRTLYMSIMGAKDLSTIATPPHDRLPITTIVARFDEQMVKNCLLREHQRGGQSYVIHNNIDNLYLLSNLIRKQLPQLKVAVVHGQLEAKIIEDVFHAFKNHEIDVICATTIVENGIDIPNANTIIIDRADNFGLSDLYQLRGRVGRWNKRSYAYLLTPKKGGVSAIAKKRLSAIEAASGYGGGMKVAMRDLEIRGSGELLGKQQSGHVCAVGFHLYCKLLKKTMNSLMGHEATRTIDTQVEFALDSKLPEYYVNTFSLRMEFYQRFGDAGSQEEIDQLFEELQERFGAAPKEAIWMYVMFKVKYFSSTRQILKVKLETYGEDDLFLLNWSFRDKDKELQEHSSLLDAMLPPLEVYEQIKKAIIEKEPPPSVDLSSSQKALEGIKKAKENLGI